MPQRGRGRYKNNGRDRSRSRPRNYKRDHNHKSKGDNNKGQHKNKKTTLADHIFNVGRAQDASDFVTNSTFIIRHIQTNYDKGADTTTALKEEKDFDFDLVKPRLQISRKDKEKKKAEYEQETAEFMKEYEIRMKSHIARQETYEDNCTKAAGLLIQQCSTSMKHKLKARTDYSKIEMEPVKLLQAIKEASMNYEADEYIYKTVFEAL